LTLKISGFRLPDHHLKNEDCVPYPLVVPKRELQLAVVVVVAAVVAVVVVAAAAGRDYNRSRLY
jgi:hypothetical protein